MFAVPTLTMILSVLVSWVVIRTQVSFRGLFDTLAFVPHAVPGILMAVGLAYLGLAYRDYFPLYGTVLIIIVAHTINWIAYGTRTTNSVMIQVHRELEEAGRVCGRVDAASPVEDRPAADRRGRAQQLDLDRHAVVPRSHHGADALHAPQRCHFDGGLAVLGQRLGSGSRRRLG